MTESILLSEALQAGRVQIGTGTTFDAHVEYCAVSDARLSIGENCHIASGSVLYAGSSIGDDCDIGHHVVIGENACLGRGTRVEHACILERGVTLGRDNVIHAQSVLRGPADIGDRNSIGPFAAIGAGPQHIRVPVSPGRIQIGNRNILREFITIHLPTGQLTAIGDDCYIMAYNHISHDTHIGNRVTMANNCQIGGHTHVMHDANLGLSCVIHQYTVIGAGAMIGMGSILVKDVPPYVTFIGGVAVHLNQIGLERQGKTSEQIESIRRLYAQARVQPLAVLVANGHAEWWQPDLDDFMQMQKRATCDYGRVAEAKGEEQ